MTVLVALIAQIFEQCFGYPQELFKKIGHPVVWQGKVLSGFEAALNRTDFSRQRRKAMGVVTLASLLLATLVASLAITSITGRLPFGWFLEGVIASSLLAGRHLWQSVKLVADALGLSLSAGREAVSHIVGRDPQALDEAGVARAAIESLAENASDGVIAPLFFLVLFGLPGIALYKAINTADSMIGHLNDRYRDFGWASAKLDDLVNFVPARLTALLIAGAAYFVKGGDARASWNAARRDAPFHNSPNAGWPEAAMAGALGFALGGPRAYQGEMVNLPRMGEGRSALGVADIRKALKVYALMRFLAFAATLILAIALAR